MEAKQEIRNYLKTQRQSLTQEEVQEYSRRICNVLAEYPGFLQAETVYFYYPIGKEVNLLPLAEKALELGKKVGFPRTCKDTMEFYQVTSLTDFAEGAFHIMEPVGERLLTEAAPLVFVPGLGFDKRKNRMGYGRGFYDRYFARYPKCCKIGTAYGVQIAEQLPTDDYDVPMDEVVTENKKFS